ncbi:MAG: hypothetical protein ABH874_01595, partial [Methanobacteriota archaeon]
RRFKKREFKSNKIKPGSSKRKRMLDMGGFSTFRFKLTSLLNKIPKESDRHPIFASVYSKASNIGIEEAEEFINTKVEEEIITKDLSIEIIALLNMYGRYR